MSSNMDSLIERLEAAEEGSRALDLFVHLASDDQPGNPPIDTYSGYDGHEFRFDYGDRQIGVWGNHVVPRYTTSIDAKLPREDELWWSIRSPNGFEPYTKWEAIACKPNTSEEYIGCAVTEPLARRAAALKARQHEKQETSIDDVSA